MDIRYNNDLKNRRHNPLAIKQERIHYELPEQTVRILRVDEETGREWFETKVTRPAMSRTTIVTTCRNRFGIIQFYGPQGHQEK